EMERMIAELIELERLRAGVGLQRARQDLVPLLRDIAAVFQRTPPGVRVIVNRNEMLLDIDAQKVRSVVRNLLDNAVKYSLPDSYPIELEAQINGRYVSIRVSDDGPGIPEADMPHVFEPFFRVDRSRSKKTGGYGLGLSISRRIVEAHGGSITAANNPRRGASFVVTLPWPGPSREPG